MPLPTTPRRSSRSSSRRRRAGSMSITVMSFCSETRLSATLSPTRPAPKMMMFMVEDVTPRAACGVTPPGGDASGPAKPVPPHPGWKTCRAGEGVGLVACAPTHSSSRVPSTKGTAEPALPGRQCRPLGGDAAGGAGGGLQRPLNDDLLNVRGAFVDLAHAHVAPDALQRKVVHVAVAAQRLDGGGADLLCRFAGEELGHGGFLQAGLAGVAQGGGVPDQLARGFELRGAVGQAETHGLVVEDGGAETLALLF